MPFTLISVVANQSNEDYIALNGLKDCHIMYLNENGQTNQEAIIAATVLSTTANPSTPTSNSTVNNNSNTASNNTSNKNGLIVLHQSLDAANYIIKSIWLPGSQTELALITADFIKI